MPGVSGNAKGKARHTSVGRRDGQTAPKQRFSSPLFFPAGHSACPLALERSRSFPGETFESVEKIESCLYEVLPAGAFSKMFVYATHQLDFQHNIVLKEEYPVL